MAIKAIYDTEAEVPEALKPYFSEKGGKWELTGVTGMKTQADVDRVLTAQRKERDDRIAAEKKLKAFDGLDAEAVPGQLLELEALKAEKDAGGFTGGVDDPAVQKVIDQRVAMQVTPLERERDKLMKKNGELAEQHGASEKRYVDMRIENEVRAVSEKSGVQAGAIDDVNMYARSTFELIDTGDGKMSVVTKSGIDGVPPGQAPADWLTDRKTGGKAHWWPPTIGGGAGGGNGEGGGSNPFKVAKGEKPNQTKIGAYVNEHGIEKATEAAKAAGCAISGYPLK